MSEQDSTHRRDTCDEGKEFLPVFHANRIQPAAANGERGMMYAYEHVGSIG